MSQKKVIVIGGGAAGMLAALFSARAGASVLLLEKNEKLGKKLYITGKGRCNVTNAAEIDEFQRNIYRNPRFMYAAFANFDNADMMRLVESLGVPLKVERGNRVFPQSDKSSDIIAALRRGLERERVEVRLNTAVQSILTEGERCVGIVTEDGMPIRGDAVILATGGLSYPSTGSTGDGHAMAEALGHTVIKPLPALAPVETVESWPGLLTGLTLKNVRLSAWTPGKKKEKCIFSEQGEMLFTHFGLSGPLVLSLSSLLPEDLTGVRLSIDLKPALDEQTLDARLLRDFKELSRKQLSTVMDGLVPHSLGEQLLRLAALSPATPVNSVTAEQRARLLKLLKDVPLRPARLRGFNEAIITRGGVKVSEINPSTMESRRVQGLYFAG